jgi:hypothetical protein
MYAFTHVRTDVHVYVFTHVRTDVHVQWICMHLHMYVQMYMYISPKQSAHYLCGVNLFVR